MVELDAVLAEVRAALPGCDAWWPRMQTARAAYHRVTKEVGQVSEGVAARYRSDVVLTSHPVARLASLLEALAVRES